jgi:long-subunit fatty acid transport protein
LLCLAPGRAFGGGTEAGAVGVVAVGRGGAFAARASDPTAMGHNVAGLVGLPGVQWTLSGNVGLWSHCFQRAGRYDGVESGVEIRTTAFASSRYAMARPAYPEVCNEVTPAVVPQALVSWRPAPWIAVGAGLLTPAGIGSQRFPDRVETPVGLAPSPARYMVLTTGVVIVHPTLAVAVAPFPWLRVGAAVQPSWGRFQGETMANAIGSQSPATDVRTAVDASAFFWAGNLGVMIQPHPSLTLGVHAHLNATPIVFTGSSTATVRPYASDPTRMHRSTFQSEVTLPLPSLVRVGVRYASLRAGAPSDSAARDPMRDEVFDLELDVHFENSSVLNQVVTRSQGNVEVEPGMGSPATPEVTLRRGWRDTWGLRAAVEVNAVPNVLALRGGVSWDLGAQTGERALNGRTVPWNPDAGIDTAGYDTVGLSLGASARWRWLTVDLAYQHLFLSGQDVQQGRAATVSGTAPITAEDCARGPGYPGPGACTNNQGVFRAAYDVFALGITARH